MGTGLVAPSTPTLAKLSPGPIANIVGNLSDKRRVLVALGLGRKLRSC